MGGNYNLYCWTIYLSFSACFESEFIFSFLDQFLVTDFSISCRLDLDLLGTNMSYIIIRFQCNHPKPIITHRDRRYDMMLNLFQDVLDKVTYSCCAIINLIFFFFIAVWTADDCWPEPATLLHAKLPAACKQIASCYINYFMLLFSTL